LHQPVYAKRLEVLSGMIASHLREGDGVLDVGCGSGQLGRAILDHPSRPSKLTVEGCEKFRRGDELIPTLQIDGHSIPAADGEFDVTILADVVHHEEKPDLLLKEVVRVTRRFVILKDHVPEGFLAFQRICFIDWAANSPYGVKCLYRYPSAAEWRRKFTSLGLEVVEEITSIDLYPPVLNVLFGKRLQYFSVLEKINQA